MTDDEAKKLLDRYLKGECTPKEESLISAWYERLANQRGNMLGTKERSRIRKVMKSAIDQEIVGVKGSGINFKFLLAAASVIIICVFAVLMIDRKPVSDSENSGLTYKIIAVRAGEKVKITLSDSSTVVLNGSSRIRYPESFDRKIREVTLLEGEAYFDIKHDSSKPFVVKAMDAKITVLGTAFNVRAYKFLKNVQVTVTRGKVSVNDLKSPESAKKAPIILTPNEQVTLATVTAPANQAFKRHIRSEEVIGWVQGRYMFDNESLGNVAKMLESYFKVRVSFESDDLKEIRFTSEFDSSDKLQDLLFAICKANNLSYKIDGQDIKFSEKKSPFIHKPN